MAEVRITKFGDPVKGSNTALIKGSKQSAIMVASQAKTLAPHNEGRLRNSIMVKLADGARHEMNNYPGEKIPAREELTSRPTAGSANVGTNLKYGTYQEFGTRNMQPVPYLRPAGLSIRNNSSAAQEQIKIAQEAMANALIGGKQRVFIR